MEAVAFGGKDASESISGTDWSNLQFNKQPDRSNRVRKFFFLKLKNNNLN